MVLDTARPRYKDNTWFGMRGRVAVRKSVFPIDFSEIQFIVNHSSQSDGGFGEF